MTCIVGLERPEGVWIGGDSALVYNGGIETCADPKVFTSGPFLIGHTGTPRGAQVLRYHLKCRKQQRDEEDHAYLCTAFVDEARRAFQGAGILRVKDEEEEHDHAWLMGYRGCLYAVYGDWQVTAVEGGWMAVGSGRDFARGALAALEQGEAVRPEVWVLRALRAAERCCTTVRAPFTIRDQPKVSDG